MSGSRLRVLCTSQPGAGHLLPMVEVLRELRRRGHQVRVASARSMAGLAAAYGLELAPVGLDFQVGDEPRLVPGLAQARARHERDYPYTREVLVQTLGQAALADTIRLVEVWRPDVIVRDPVEFAGLAAAEAAGLPHLTGRENRFLPLPVWRSELGDALAALGRAAGAGELEAASLYRYLGLAPALPAFVTATAALPDPREFGASVAPTMRFIRPRTPRRETASERETSAGGTSSSSDAILITFGTVFAPARLRASAAAAVHALRRPVIWPNSGRGWRDFDEVLPRCRVMVTVGGFGTVMAALRYGVPLVVSPVGADHWTTAARCAALGVGAVVAPEQLSGATLRASIELVAGDPSYRARAAELAAEWTSLPDADWATSQVEELAWARPAR